MIIDRLVRNGTDLRVVPRHKMAPFQIGAPSFRIQRLPHGGMDSIGRDQQITLGIWQPDTCSPVNEPPAHGSPHPVSSQPIQMVARQHTISAETVPSRGQQDQLQVAPVDGELRPMVAGVQPARFRPDALAMLVVVGQFRRRNGDFRQCIAQAEIKKSRTAWGRRLIPTPSGCGADTLSKTRQSTPI